MTIDNSFYRAMRMYGVTGKFATTQITAEVGDK